MNTTDAAPGGGPHGQARAVLAERARADGRPMHQAPIAESRAAQWEWLPYMGEPAPMAEVRTRFVPAPTADIPVTVYTPTGEGPFPALVMFHGGCWIVGNIELSDRPHRALAEATGCVVVAVNYQKAPEHPFPVPLDDCYAAYLWTCLHAGQARSGRLSRRRLWRQCRREPGGRGLAPSPRRRWSASRSAGAHLPGG